MGTIETDINKEINDNYDHLKGDLYLKQFALAIQTAVKDQGEVYRFAGDEFICLINRDIVKFNSDSFRDNIAREMLIDVPYQGFSLGLAYYPEDGLSSDELISLADQAMYIEKKTKKYSR